jgi:hypothetical protein
MYASAGAMHLSMGHTWVWARGLSAGQHTIMLEAGPTTVTDQNDVACVTVIEPNDGLKILFAEDAPCPKGMGQALITARAETNDNGVWISGSSSGWATVANNTVRSALLYDGGDGTLMEVFANNANQHLSVVPTDNIQDTNRGNHEFQVYGGGVAATDLTDYAHLSVVEWVDYTQGPSYLSQIQNVAAQGQQGGGAVVGSLPVPSKGGTLLVRVGVSGWSGAANQTLSVAVLIDGDKVGSTQVFANPSTTHMSLVPNDLVVAGIPAGNHNLTLVANGNTITDLNDRVSVMVMEFHA